MNRQERKLAAVLLLAVGLSAGVAPLSCSNGGASAGSKKEISITTVTSGRNYLDPAMGYTTSSREPMWAVYTPLLTYRRAEDQSVQLIPGLAAALPEISDNGRTYRLQLREGLRYSDGRPVKASDFEHAVKRLFILDSPGTTSFKEIEGAKTFSAAKRQEADIPGIDTDDVTGRITIRLEKPESTFPHVLTMVFSGLVPGDTPFRILTANPPPGVGPYRVVRSDPGREVILEKNPYFDVAGIPKAQVDRITVKIMDYRQQQALGSINRLDCPRCR